MASPLPGELDPELHRLLMEGRRDATIEWLLAVPAERRGALRPMVKAHHDLVLAEPTGEKRRGAWRGPLHSAHWSTAAAALMGTSTLKQAVRYHPLDSPDSVDLPVAFFPDDLGAFVREWSGRFLRKPKAWDRIRGLDAMFEWAHRGLIEPPLDDGAVLLLATALPGAVGRGGRLLRYLEERPCLMNTTMARIFDVDGTKGASLAQADQTAASQRRRLDNFVIPQLVARGHWTHDFVRSGIARALARGQTPYLERWFAGLRARFPAPEDR